jgi:hypothetical protein
LNKIIFNDENFYVDPGKPASESDSLRRVDGVVKYFEAGTLITRVLLFCEAKNHAASEAEMRAVEGQVHEACGTYCGTSELTHVYAMGILGTIARLWKFERPAAAFRLYLGLRNTKFGVPISTRTQRKLIVSKRV